MFTHYVNSYEKTYNNNSNKLHIKWVRCNKTAIYGRTNKKMLKSFKNVANSRYKQHFCTFYSTLGCKNGVFFNLLRFSTLVLVFLVKIILRKSQKALETCVNTRVW